MPHQARTFGDTAPLPHAPDPIVYELHVKGFKGRACLDAVKLFEEIVGEMKSQQQTSEFYEPEEQVQYRLDQRH